MENIFTALMTYRSFREALVGWYVCQVVQRGVQGAVWYLLGVRLRSDIVEIVRRHV